jgi:hypothetical protein
MKKLNESLAELPALVFDKSGPIFAAGAGLMAIAELLGADGSEHHINAEQTDGLHHAIYAIGAMLKGEAYSLSGAAEELGGGEPLEAQK